MRAFFLRQSERVASVRYGDVEPLPPPSVHAHLLPISAQRSRDDDLSKHLSAVVASSFTTGSFVLPSHETRTHFFSRAQLKARPRGRLNAAFFSLVITSSVVSGSNKK